MSEKSKMKTIEIFGAGVAFDTHLHVGKEIEEIRLVLKGEKTYRFFKPGVSRECPHCHGIIEVWTENGMSPKAAF